MRNFVKIPNLPQNKVKTIICGKLNNKLENFINSYEINMIMCDANNAVDKRISSHADISVHHISKKEIVIGKAQSQLYKALTDIGMNVTYTNKLVCGKYPDDCILNFARVGKYLIGKFDCIDDSLSQKSKNSTIQIDVKQGYAKCSVCVVNENALITDDESIYKACTAKGLDCLLISKGDVNLDGFDYGFIGGSAGMIDKNHLLFFGDITKHRSFDKIEEFLQKHGCRFDYIENYPLSDIGGIIPIIEEV